MVGAKKRKNETPMKSIDSSLNPGILTSLPGRYAKALFDLAQKQNQIESIGEKLQALENLTQSSPILQQALQNPTLPHEGQAATLMEICVLLKAPDILQSFLKHLVKAQRLPYLSGIEKIYRQLVVHAKGEQILEIISAWPLTPAQVSLLETHLEKAFPGKKNLSFINNPKVLGGIMVRIGSRVMDATLATQLNQLATIMKGTASWN